MRRAGQHMEALRAGDVVRLECAGFKRSLGRGDISLPDAVQTCQLPITVTQLLTAAPRYGSVRASEAVRLANLPAGDLRFGGTSGGSKGRVLTDTERNRLHQVVCGVVPAGANRRRLVLLDEFQKRNLRTKMYNAGCTAEQIDEVLAA